MSTSSRPADALLGLAQGQPQPFRCTRTGHHLDQLASRLGGQTAADQLADYLVRRQLIQLVQRDQRAGAEVRRHCQRLEQARQHPPRVELDGELRQLQRGEYVVLRAQRLGIRQQRRRAQRVQVALGELAVPVLAGTVGSPHGADHVPLVRRGQLAAVSGHDPRQRHRQVIPQRKVGLARCLVLAAPEDLENQLVAFVAVLAQQHIESLEGRRLQRLVAVAAEHVADDREGMLALVHLRGEEVTST